MLKIFSVLLVVLFGLPLTVQAVGLSVSPSSLDIFYPDVLTQKIKIQNISSEPIKIYVRADDFSKEISLEPAEFDLLPQEIALVNISADFNHLSAGVRKTNISVLSQALDKKSFNAVLLRPFQDKSICIVAEHKCYFSIEPVIAYGIN